jgi:glyoxylase-like metal-dependent hydrolase (beta-lactamase superfamily II)
MVSIQHLNFGWLHAPPFPPACCHGLLIRTPTGIALVETGIGLADIADPDTRIGREAIDGAGFQFLPSVTAVRQLEALGISPGDVSDIVLTHCDSDHAGGLADFPNANVHVSVEEKRNLDTGNPRYQPAQFSHELRWVIHDRNDSEMLDLPTRQIRTALDVDIRLVPLFGHTNGHCGVAISFDGGWLLHVGDAYYLRGELTDENHPVGQLATLRADDNAQRLRSLDCLRNLVNRSHGDLTLFGYHDVAELPPEIPSLEDVAKAGAF